MIVAMIALSGLVLLGSMTVMSVQGGITAVGLDRHKSAALYAAESGAAAAMDFLRRNVRGGGVNFGDYVEPYNTDPQRPAGIVGNGALPGTPGNLLSPDMNAWYEVEILNNVDDTGFAAGDDTDATVIIRSTGHGANGTMAMVEWRVGADTSTGRGPPCGPYGQEAQTESGAAWNPCMRNVNAGDTATYSPSTP